MRRKTLFAIISLTILLIFIIDSIPVSAAGSEDDSDITLTMDEAVSRAIRYSDNLEKAELSTEMADDRLTDAQLDFQADWIIDYVPGTEQYYVALLNARYKYDAAVKNEEIMKDSIIALEQNYNIAQLNLEIAEENLKHTELKHSVGLVSEIDVIKAELALIKQQNNIFSMQCQHELLKIAFEQPWS